jgi:TolA-binding protein
MHLDLRAVLADPAVIEQERVKFAERANTVGNARQKQVERSPEKVLIGQLRAEIRELRSELSNVRAKHLLAEQKIVEQARAADSVREQREKGRQLLLDQITERDTEIKSLHGRLRDYEILLGFDPPVTEAGLLAQIAPWMLEIAAKAAQSAPEALDERALTMLIVDAIVEAYAERTVEAAAIVGVLSSTSAGAALLEMERAIRHVSELIKFFPASPATSRKDAIMQAWEELNQHTKIAKAQLEDELRLLLEQERSEAYQASAIAQIVMPAKSRPIAVVRTPEAPPPPPVQAEAPGILAFPNLASLGDELADLDEF